MKEADFRANLGVLRKEAGLLDETGGTERYTQHPLPKKQVESVLDWLGRDKSQLDDYNDKGLIQ